MKVPEVKTKIILASQSPRRRYLLERAGLRFAVIPSRLDETSVTASSPDAYVRDLAVAKAMDIGQKYPASWVIGADTVVVAEDRVLGKPATTAQARDMLRQLSGRMHQVLTGYCICRRSDERMFADTVRTDVLFKTLTDEEIEWYIQTGEPFDKAGAYAIQGIGTFLVKRINGSYTNVVGLPVCEVLEFLIREQVVGFDQPHPLAAGPPGEGSAIDP
jgi:septum formation protein